MERYLTDPGQKVLSPTTRGPWSTTLALTIDDDLRETSMASRSAERFFVPLEHARDAVRRGRGRQRLVLFFLIEGRRPPRASRCFEFRCVKGDGSWISPHPADSLGVHMSFNADPALLGGKDAVAAIEAALRPSASAHTVSSAAAHRIEAANSSSCSVTRTIRRFPQRARAGCSGEPPQCE